LLPDLLPQLFSLNNPEYMQYSWFFQTLICTKISRHQHLPILSSVTKGDIMEFIAILLIAAAVFGVCYLVDKAFTKAFRSKAQHRSGKAVRAPRRYGIFSVLLTVMGIASVCIGITDGWVMLAGSIIILVIGVGLAVYYLSFGVFYDGETMLVCSFGKKDREYYFREIQGQKLYLVQGGNIIVELHISDGTAVSLQSSMDGVYLFLDTAFAGWCMQKGIDPQSCSFHDPSQSLWFPVVEDV
jgi:membrane protein YqaA with SNARE-associated domain